MSEPVSALRQRETGGTVEVRDTGLRGMISLRGDLSRSKLRSVCTNLTGADFPAIRQACLSGRNALCWMSPDEVLLVMPYEEVADGLTRIAKTLSSQHHLAVDVSDARAVLDVSGPYAREVIAKLAPVDLHPDAIQPGEILRTRLGQIAAAFWMRDAETFEVICFRSVADYAFDLLAASAKAGPVGHFPRGT